MFNHSWKKELLTIPNLLSIFRLLLIPVYIGMYRKAAEPLDYYLAGTVLAVSCLTDLADGKIARGYNMVTTTGKLLDPLADKLTQLALILSLSGTHPSLYPVLILFVLKETFQFVTMLVFIRNGKILPGALLSGKVCTTVLFGSLLLLVLFPSLSETAVLLLAVTDGAFLLYAFAGYSQAYFGKDPKLTEFPKE